MLQRAMSTSRLSSLGCVMSNIRVSSLPYPRHGLGRRSIHRTAPRRSESSAAAELGLRSTLPPDSNPPPTPEDHRSDKPQEISDQEWEIRTGRAIYVLQETLPDFFSIGLVSSVDKATAQPRIPGSALAASISPLLSPSPKEVESIYSPKVQLSYTPPVALPVPFPRTLHVEGLPLYMASSVFIRHTLNALYSDLHVVLRRLTVQTPTPGSSTGGVSADGGQGISKEEHGPEGDNTADRIVRKNREKSVFIGLSVSGTARVSGGPGEWDVNSTYTFSPLTGLIHTHVINSIHPAPHQAVYDALRTSLGKVFGMGALSGGPHDPRPSAGGAACRSEAAEEIRQTKIIPKP